MKMGKHSLVLIHAKRGIIEFKPYPILTLEDVDTSVAYLKLDPNREAGKIGLQEFLDSYAEQLRIGGALNSAYVFYENESQGNFSDVTVNLKNPIYDASEKTLSFSVDYLKENQIITPGKIDEVTLFIDDTVSIK